MEARQYFKRNIHTIIIFYRVDIPRRTLDYNITFPELEFVGKYKVSGNLFFLPIAGQGNFWERLRT